jgi:streptogramin lyase
VGVDEVIEQVEAGGGDPRDKLWQLWRLASEESIGDLMQIDLAVRDWARRDEAVAARLRRVDNRRMDYMRSLFATFCPDADEVEARSLIAFSLWIGNHFIAADHGQRTRNEVVGVVMRRLLH